MKTLAVASIECSNDLPSCDDLPSQVKCKVNDSFNGLCGYLTSVSLHFPPALLPKLIPHPVGVEHTGR